MADLKNSTNHKASDFIHDAAMEESSAVLQRLGTSLAGLSEEEASARLGKYGLNEVAHERQQSWLYRLYIAARNPLVILLTVLAILTFVTAETRSDYFGGVVMVAMVVLGVSLRFIQETKANTAAAKLKAMISVTATVVRDGQPKEIPLKQLVPGDVVKLSAGDMIPGDVRLLSAKDLFIIQATLTGESMPVEKTDVPDPRPNVSSIEHTNICFLGTSVESGSATGVIIATGAQTYFGKVASSLAASACAGCAPRILCSTITDSSARFNSARFFASCMQCSEPRMAGVAMSRNAAMSAFWKKTQKLNKPWKPNGSPTG